MADSNSFVCSTVAVAQLQQYPLSHYRHDLAVDDIEASTTTMVATLSAANTKVPTTRPEGQNTPCRQMHDSATNPLPRPSTSCLPPSSSYCAPLKALPAGPSHLTFSPLPYSSISTHSSSHTTHSSLNPHTHSTATSAKTKSVDQGVAQLAKRAALRGLKSFEAPKIQTTVREPTLTRTITSLSRRSPGLPADRKSHICQSIITVPTVIPATDLSLIGGGQVQQTTPQQLSSAPSALAQQPLPQPLQELQLLPEPQPQSSTSPPPQLLSQPDQVSPSLISQQEPASKSRTNESIKNNVRPVLRSILKRTRPTPSLSTTADSSGVHSMHRHQFHPHLDPHMQYQHLQHFSARAPAPVQDSFSFHKQLQSPLYVKLPSPVDPPEYVWSRPLPTPPATKSVCWGENQVREIEHREDYLQMSSGYGVEAEPEIDEGQQAYYRDHSMELGPCYGDDHDQGHSRRRHRHHRNHRRHGHQGRILITTAVTTGDEHEDQQMTLTPSSSEDENDLDMDLSSDESGSEDMSVRRVHQDIVHSCLGWSAVASIPECDNETSDISESDVSVDEHDHEEEGDIVTDGESTGRFVTNHQASLSRPSGQGFGSVMEHDPLPPQRRSPPPPRPPRRDFFSGGIFSRTDLSKYYSFETTAASSAKDQDPTHIASSSGEASKGIAPELVTSSFSHDLSSPVQTRHPYCPQLDRDEIRAQTAERRARSGGLGRQGGQDDDQYGSRRGSHLPWSPSSAYEFQYGSLMGSSLAIQLQSHYDHDEVPLSNMHRHQRHPQTHRLQFEYRYEYRPQPQFQYRYQSQPENRHDSGESSPLSMSSPSPVQSPILPPGSSGIVGDNSGDVVGTSFESKSDGTPSPPTSIRLTERFPSRATECMGESTFA